MNYKEAYQQAHYNWQMDKHKDFYVMSGCYSAKMPPIKKSNGLTKFIVNYINWTGGNATRVSSAGRFIEKKNAQGHKIDGSGIFIPSTTKKGTADITATIKGRSVKIEIKIGNDKPSEYQLKEQAKERAAGGIYAFVKTPEDFINLYETL